MPDFDNRSLRKDEDEVRLTLDEPTPEGVITDDGHTAGGGCLGQDQPE